MKNKIFLAFLLCVLCLRTLAQNTDGAYIKFDKGDSHDFGTLTHGPQVLHEFVFVNNGDKDLVIKEVKSSCKCLLIHWPSAPIKAGETGNIQLELKTDDLRGVFSKELYVVSNAVLPEGQTQNKLIVKGEVKERIKPKTN